MPDRRECKLMMLEKRSWAGRLICVSLRANFREQQAIDEFALFEVACPQSAFTFEAGLFKDSSGCRITRINSGMNPDKMEVSKSPSCECGDGFRHDSASPKGFSEPVTQFRDVS